MEALIVVPVSEILIYLAFSLHIFASVHSVTGDISVLLARLHDEDLFEEVVA